jgi:hypothetical protein
MERGELGVAYKPVTVFVFEGLIAQLKSPKTERLNLRAHRWDAALYNWAFDQQVLDYINAALQRFEAIVDVFTWHPPEFAQRLHDYLWQVDVPVRETKSTRYDVMSIRVATDPEVSIVYDPDPAHRWGYGFKAREFDPRRF